MFCAALAEFVRSEQFAEQAEHFPKELRKFVVGMAYMLARRQLRSTAHITSAVLVAVGVTRCVNLADVDFLSQRVQ